MFIELLKEFINLIFGNVYNKTGLSLLALTLGLILIFAQIENEIEKPKWFYIAGSIFIAISIILLIKRYSELKQKIKKPNA